MPFKIEISETDHDEVVSNEQREYVQQAAHLVYQKLKKCLPEIENEKENFMVTYIGTEVIADTSKLSAELQEKIKNIIPDDTE